MHYEASFGLCAVDINRTRIFLNQHYDGVCRCGAMASSDTFVTGVFWLVVEPARGPPCGGMNMKSKTSIYCSEDTANDFAILSILFAYRWVR